MEFNFSNQLTFKDYVQYNKTHSKNTFWGKYEILFYIVLFLFIVTPSLFKFKNALQIAIVHFIIPFVALVTLYLVDHLIIRPTQYKRHFKSNIRLSKIAYYKISEDTIEIKNDSEYATLKKDEIYKILFDKDSIYIYTALTLSQIIKKRSLNSENEFKELVEFIKENYVKTK
ncbi:hypothetical protein FACS189485_20400 [Spirochaetia bacterium]|nr:hypothetical protein FACS189485_20400 [Spirochaetia bacterium]